MELSMDLTFQQCMRLIAAYKRHPILWNPLMSDNSRQIRETAWNMIAVEAEIHPTVTKNKLRCLSVACKKEQARILKCRKNNIPYRTKWRYWNAFKFIRGLNDEDEDPLGEAPEMDILDPTLTPSLLKTKIFHQKQSEKEMAINDSNGTPDPLAATDSSQTPSTPKESTSVEQHGPSFGTIVAAKLRKMYHDQRLFAENVIHQALFKGLMHQLTPHSTILTPNYSRKTSVTGNAIVQGCKSVPGEPSNMPNPREVRTVFHSLDAGSKRERKRKIVVSESSSSD